MGVRAVPESSPGALHAGDRDMEVSAGRAWEPGSFRDRASRVFRHEGEVLRALNAEGLADWEALCRARWFEHLQETRKIVRTRRVDGSGDEAQASEQETKRHAATVRAAADEGGWVATLRHETIPFVSYPYEWPFGMLQDAALLHLEVLETALAEGMILKDGSSFNVQWIGTRPIFVDIGSFTRLRPGAPWVGYRQFCRLFLFPLLIQAYKDVPFQPWLRGCLDGISAADCRQLMSIRDLFRPGVFTHVWLQARAEARHDAGIGRAKPARPEDRRDVRAALRRAGFHAGLIQANVGRLKGLVGGLRWHGTRSRWAGYAQALPYTKEEQAEKVEFVRRVVHARRWSMVWDLGCNTGDFARIAAERATTVVAIDSDPLVVERLYRTLKEERATRILPLVGDVADPSSDRGWRGAERQTLEGRAQPALILILALVHHLSLGASIPLAEIVAWLAGLGAAVVVEFVERDDPMVRALLRHKDELYGDYDRTGFERCWGAAFDTKRRQVLASGHRILYYGEPKTCG